MQPQILPVKFSLFICLMNVAILCGCSKTGPDIQALGDEQITGDLLVNFEQKDAIEFLENGGRYIDWEESEPEDEEIDQPIVLPLLKSLHEEFGFEWIAAVDPEFDEKEADSIYAKIPTGIARKDVEKHIDEQTVDFKGHVIQQWGHEYLLLDFLTGEELDALPGLKKKIEENK